MGLKQEIIPFLLSCAQEINVTFFLVLDFSYFSHGEIYGDEKIQNEIAGIILEAQQYDKAMVIFDLDEIADQEKKYSGLKQELLDTVENAIQKHSEQTKFTYQINQPKSYRFCLQKINHGVDISKEHYFIILSSNNRLTMEFKEISQWPISERDAMQKNIIEALNKNERCVRCFQQVQYKSNQAQSCSMHSNQYLYNSQHYENLKEVFSSLMKQVFEIHQLSIKIEKALELEKKIQKSKNDLKGCSHNQQSNEYKGIQKALDDQQSELKSLGDSYDLSCLKIQKISYLCSQRPLLSLQHHFNQQQQQLQFLQEDTSNQDVFIEKILKKQLIEDKPNEILYKLINDTIFEILEENKGESIKNGEELVQKYIEIQQAEQDLMVEFKRDTNQSIQSQNSLKGIINIYKDKNYSQQQQLENQQQFNNKFLKIQNKKNQFTQEIEPLKWKCCGKSFYEKGEIQAYHRLIFTCKNQKCGKFYTLEDENQICQKEIIHQESFYLTKDYQSNLQNLSNCQQIQNQQLDNYQIVLENLQTWNKLISQEEYWYLKQNNLITSQEINQQTGTFTCCRTKEKCKRIIQHSNEINYGNRRYIWDD